MLVVLIWFWLNRSKFNQRNFHFWSVSHSKPYSSHQDDIDIKRYRILLVASFGRRFKFVRECSATQTPTQKLKNRFSIFSSHEMLAIFFFLKLSESNQGILTKPQSLNMALSDLWPSNYKGMRLYDGDFEPSLEIYELHSNQKPRTVWICPLTDRLEVIRQDVRPRPTTPGWERWTP